MARILLIATGNAPERAIVGVRRRTDGGRIDSAKDYKLRWSHSTNARWHATETTRPQYTYLPHDTITVLSLLLATSEQELKLQGVFILFY